MNRAFEIVQDWKARRSLKIHERGWPDRLEISLPFWRRGKAIDERESLLTELFLTYETGTFLYEEINFDGPEPDRLVSMKIPRLEVLQSVDQVSEGNWYLLFGLVGNLDFWEADQVWITVPDLFKRVSADACIVSHQDDCDWVIYFG